jgi:translocation and assembly module TamA
VSFCTGFLRCALLTAVLVLRFGAMPAHAQTDSVQSDSDSFVRFRVIVDAPKPLASLLEGGLDLVRWQEDEKMTMDLLQRLVAEARLDIERAVAAEGYFSPTVRTAIEREDKGTVVRIVVDPGPRTVVSGVDLRFRGPVAETDPDGQARMAAVRSAWKLPAGEPFRQEDWDAAKRGAVTELSRVRYAAASITHSEARVDPEQRSVALQIELESGPPFRVGETGVSGTSRYPASIVENLNPIKAGETYDASRLALFQRRLLETGYFGTVQIRVPPDPAKADAVPVEVTVTEARSQRIDTGVSFSTDARLGVQLNYTNQDLFDSALRLRSQLKADAKAQVFDTSVDTPPRPGGVWNTVNAKYQQTDIQNQRTREEVVGVSYNWGVETTPSHISLSAHAERQIIEGSNTEHNNALFLNYRTTFRMTDDPLLPRRGLLGIINLGTSVPGLATQDFMRATAKAHFLLPLGKQADVALRAEGGIVAANSRFGVPSSFLFRTGGDQTVRGYEFESIGVRQGNAIVGGRYLALASAEYTWWFKEDWGAAVFVDAGDAFDNRSAIDVKVGYGIGARWRSPIGPFRADLAYGQDTGKVRMHFSVGFSF